MVGALLGEAIILMPVDPLVVLAEKPADGVIEIVAVAVEKVETVFLVRAGPRLMESQFLATTAQDTGREEAEHREDVMVTEVALVDMGRQVL